jgi:hypothetical protein
MKKEELVAFIREARGIRDEAPAKKKKAARIKVTKVELKARIRRLKASKGEALEASDSRKVSLLRHRISRLKKRSRRAA